MKLVIDIPEKYLNSNIIDVTLITGANNTITDVNVEDKYAEFQVLPKGHGDLIYRDEAFDVLDNANLSLNLSGLLRYVSTAIPADEQDEA